MIDVGGGIAVELFVVSCFESLFWIVAWIVLGV
jgi:hypothetical protein